MNRWLRRSDFSVSQGCFDVEIHPREALHALNWPGAADDRHWHLHAFQAREFLDVWFRTIGAARKAQALLVIVRDAAGEPFLYLPLCLEKKAGVRAIRFPDGGVADYNAPVLRRGSEIDASAFPALWASVLAALPAADLIYLDKIPARIVEAPNPLMGIGVGLPQARGTSVTGSQGWTEYAAEKSRRDVLSQAHRKLRRLSRDVPVRFHFGEVSEEAGTRCIEFLIELKRRQYLRTEGVDVMGLPGYIEFFREMASPAQLGRISQLCYLTAGDKIAAAHLGYATASRFYYILPAADLDEFGKFSAGTTLFIEMVKACRDRSVVCDLGIGDEPYKDIWATDHVNLHAHVQPLTTLGWLAAQALNTRRSPMFQTLLGRS
jgi:CelD/BcsL family acetyltransferase involved in cellulose biosynthesis